MKVFDWENRSICGEKFERYATSSSKCKNRWVNYYAFTTINIISFFMNPEEQYIIDNITQSQQEKENIIKQIEERIAYWKENDRYLIKILSGQ